MPVYALAQLSIHDRARYGRYVAGFMPVLRRFEGTVLAADESPRVVEGAWDGDKVVLLEFPDQDAFFRWATSPEYVDIARDRIAATSGSVVLVDGVRPAPTRDASTGRCPECGFEYDLGQAEAAGDAILETAGEMSALLAGGSERLAARREPRTWSPLEYACHVRDVLLVQRERVLMARRVDRPSFAPMGRDERADHDGYGEQDPAAVARQLSDAALLFANVLARLAQADWDRCAVYSYPQPAERSLRWVAVHTVHEAVHHLADMRRQLS